MTAEMTGAELACTRAFLGFSLAQLAEYLQTTKPRDETDDDATDDEWLDDDGITRDRLAIKNFQRRLQRMEQDKAAVPVGIVDEIDEMYEVANNLVNNLVLQYKAKVKKAADSGEDVVLLTQRDGDTRGRYPACWHRAVCARVVAQVPGLLIDYDD